MLEYCFNHYGRRVVVSRQGQVIRAEIDSFAGFSELPQTYKTPSSGEDLTVLDSDCSWNAPIFSSVAAAGVDSSFTPLFALAAKAKAFDDRLIMAVEQLAHHGAGQQIGLYELTARLRGKLQEGTALRGLFDGAAHLTGQPLPDFGTARLMASKWLAPFLKTPRLSKPIGAYTHSELLSQIFKSDRLLQSELNPSEAAQLRELLAANHDLLAAYRNHLALISRLTGSFVMGSVLDARAGKKSAFLPASDSAEGRLIKALFGDRPIPDGFELGRELVTRIRDGRLATVPSEKDGWYAYQFHAIAALLAPETDGLIVGPKYREELEQAFLALFALNRETHVKQLECPAAGGVPLIVAPRVTVEPLPEYYQRVALGYQFVREQLSAILGDAVMNSATFDDGKYSLVDGLLEMQCLFRGAEVVARTELGQSIDESPEQLTAQTWFRSWQRQSDQDPDLAADLRVAVPVYYDLERQTVRLCVTVGLETRSLRFEYSTPPQVEVYGESSSGFADDKPQFEDSQVLILSPITVECDVRKPPTRQELRALCDEYGEPKAVKEALMSL